MTSAIASLLDEGVANGSVLGVSYIAVDKAGNTLYSGAHGYRTLKRDEPMTLGTGAWLASMTKNVTSVAVMHAVDKGLLTLDDDVTDILPEIKEKQIMVGFDEKTNTAAYRDFIGTITLRRLLSHSSGFCYTNFDPTLFRWGTANDKNLDKFHGTFAADWDRPMVADPGKAFNYSPGIDWAARILEKVTKMSLGEYMQENIFKPLGMKNTTFHPEKHPSFPPMQEMTTRPDGPNSPLVACPCPYPIPAKEEAGGAGLFSTAEDYAKLVTALLQDDNPILSKKALEEFVSPQLTAESKASLAKARDTGMILPEIPKEIPTDFSLSGLYMDSDVPDRRAKGTVSWDGMSSPNWLVDRRSGVAVVFVTQIMIVDPASKALWWAVEKELYKMVRERK